VFWRVTVTVAILLPLLPTAAARGQDPATEKPLPEKAWDVLRGAAEIDAFHLDPTGPAVFAGEWKYQVMSIAKTPGARKGIIDALDEGVKKAGKNKDGKFEPRYGVRATSGDTTVELVIDFELGEIRISSGQDKAVIRTSGSPQSFFAKLFEI
jgi:hypothetical protein